MASFTYFDFQQHWLCSTLVCCLALLVVGCTGDQGIARHPVAGTVWLNKQPLVEARVVFHPREANHPELPLPQAETDSAGRFALTTLQPGDGAPAGNYAITIEQRDLIAVGEEMIRNGKQLLPVRYRDPAKSGLSYTVIAGANDVPELHLVTP